MTAIDEAADYTAVVRDALSDLDAAEREKLMEGLEDHLAEVAAAAGGSLTERLGPPEAYAAGLRAAYGERSSHKARRGFRRHSPASILAGLLAVVVAASLVLSFVVHSGLGFHPAFLAVLLLILLFAVLPIAAVTVVSLLAAVHLWRRLPTRRRRPGASAGSRGRRRRRLAVRASVPLVIALIVGSWLAWQTVHARVNPHPWSSAQLMSEARAGDLSRVQISGRSALATTRAGSQHDVQVPDDTGAMAQELVKDGVDVSYDAPQSPATWLTALVGLLGLLFVYIAPVGSIVVIAGAACLAIRWLLRATAPPSES